MTLRLGNAEISTLRLGTATPSKAMLGDVQVWPVALSLDPDAAAYTARVEAADGQALEAAFKTALSNLVVYAKATSSVNGGTLWSRIRNWVLLSGPRTVSGAMVVPLVGGVQPVAVNLTGGMHTRRGGIQGSSTLRIETGIALPDGLPLAGGVQITAPASTPDGTFWGDSQVMPPPFMLGNGGGTTVNPPNTAFTYRPGNSTIFIVGGPGISPFNPHAFEFLGAVSCERTSNVDAGASFDVVRDNIGLATRQNPGAAVTTRGPVDLFSRRSGTVFPSTAQLGGFIQGSLSALECNDLLNRYQAAVAANIP